MDYKKKSEELEFLIKNLYPTMTDYQKEKVEGIFPELRESEDDRNERLHNGVIESLICYRAKLYDEGDKEVAAIVDEEISWMRDCWKKQKCEWSEEDEKWLREAISIITQYDCICKKEGDKCYTANAVIDWLKSIKPQLKQEWSEEDEKISDAIYQSIDFLILKDFGITEDEAVDFLKSPKPQPHWRPSREQLEALWDIIPHLPNCEEDVDKITNLSLLYDELKKL